MGRSEQLMQTRIGKDRIWYQSWYKLDIIDGTIFYSLISMCLGLSETNIAQTYSDDKETQLRALFDPLVKPEMKASWEKGWKSWFVTTSEVPDLRKPGKLKGYSLRMN